MLLVKPTGFVGKRVAQVGGGSLGGAHDVVVVLCDCVSRFYSDTAGVRRPVRGYFVD